MDDSSAPLLVDRRGPSVWLRLNRPERRNAYDEDMLEAMLASIAETPRDHLIVITGSGGSFCSGGYLANLASPDEAALRRMFYGSLRLFDALRGHAMPVIAAVNGAAVGGGNELVVACDLAIAAESAF
jgi:2-ketocyclohexanecarboxyl-CoA hydrolase